MKCLNLSTPELSSSEGMIDRIVGDDVECLMCCLDIV
jgi:hypothetical protein